MRFGERVARLDQDVDRALGRDRAERTTTLQQIFGRSALERLEGGAASLVSPPGQYDAERAEAEEVRRRQLEDAAAEEVRLTDAGERGVHTGV